MPYFITSLVYGWTAPFPAFRLAVGGRARVWCGSRGLSRRRLGQSRGALSVVLLSLTSRPEARLSVATPVLFARGCNVGGCGCVLLRLAASGCCAPASGASGACDTSPPPARGWTASVARLIDS